LSGNLKQTGAMLVLAVLVGWLYHDVLAALVLDWWNDPNNSHGFLVPLVSLYVAAQHRERLFGTTPRPALFGVLVVALGILALAAGNVGAVLYVERASLVVVLAGLIVLNLGWGHFRLLAFPVLFLLLAVPPPAIVLNAVAFPLQLFAASTAEWVLYWLDIPVLREGNLMQLAHTTLEVADACSGIRSLVSLLALAIVFAYFFHRSWLARGVLTLSAVPIAVVTNAGRVAGTGVLVHYFGPAAAEGFYHSFSGWLLFVSAFVLLAAESALIRWLGRPRNGPRNGGSDPRAA
jgi:exosortase